MRQNEVELEYRNGNPTDSEQGWNKSWDIGQDAYHTEKRTLP